MGELIKASATASSAIGGVASARPASRDSRLDAFRGLMLLLMTLYHTPGPLHDLSLEQLGYVSEAEGFVFLSGLVAGLTYTRYSAERGDTIVWRLALGRARTIYFHHIVTLIVAYIILQKFITGGLPEASRLAGVRHGMLQTAIAAGLLLFQPRFLDILPMYCVFMLFTPVVILQLKRGNMLRVLVASVGTWTAAQFGLRADVVSLLPKFLPVDPGFFDIFAWQLLFVWGVCFGFIWFSRPVKGFRPQAPLVVYALIVACVLLLIRQNVVPTVMEAGKLAVLTDKGGLGAMRILNTAAILCLVTSAFPLLKSGRIVAGLAYLGRHSLQVFSFHVILLYLMMSFVGRGGPGPGASAFMALLCMGSLYLPAFVCERLKDSRVRISKSGLRDEAARQ